MDALVNTTIPLWAILAYIGFMCFVQGMPRPVDKSSPGYVWLYRSLHLLCCNLSLALDPLKKLKGELPELGEAADRASAGGLQ